MQTNLSSNFSHRAAMALADYDFLRSTYEVLLRAAVPNYAAIDAAFESLESAHARLQTAHRQLRASFLN